MLSIGLLSCGEGMCLKMVADVLKTICLREVCYIKMQSFSPFQNDFVSLQPQTKRQMARLKVLIPRENKLTPEQRREALELGKLGEQMATKYLEDNGYTILERNYRKGHLEIDIIALDPHSEFNAPYATGARRMSDSMLLLLSKTKKAWTSDISRMPSML